jgi:CII-binding regulator of phage lambda lysogenization HflD
MSVLQSWAHVDTICAALVAVVLYQMRHIGKQFDQVDKRFDQIDKRFDHVDKRIDNFMSEMPLLSLSPLSSLGARRAAGVSKY